MAKVLIIGLGRSGLAAARLAKAQGRSVLAYDENPVKESVAAECRNEGIDVIKRIELTDGEKELVCVVSPGVPFSDRRFDKLRIHRTISEVQFAWENMQGMGVAVTGTNGKSTTVSLISHLLNAEGAKAVPCGNFGIPLSEIVLLKEHDKSIKVVELSSFQLEHIQGIEPAVSVCLDITENHLNRYPSFSDYMNAKLRLFTKNSTASHCMIHKNVMTMNPGLSCRHLTVAGGRKAEGELNFEITSCGARGDVNFKYDFSRGIFCKPHNIENAVFAIGAVYFILRRHAKTPCALDTFENLHFRQEKIETGNDITVINDSKSTSPDATLKALQLFREPLILIIGGRNKNSTFREFSEKLSSMPAKVVAYGESSSFFKQIMPVNIPFKMENRLEDAVRAAVDWMENEKVIIFSPACESFDQFDGYRHRGECFNNYIIKYIKKGG